MNYFISRSLGYLSNGQLQDKLLSAYKISQAYLAHPQRGDLTQLGPTPRGLIVTQFISPALKGRHRFSPCRNRPRNSLYAA